MVRVYVSSVHRRQRRHRVGAHPRLQRAAAVAPGHRRQPHREQRAERPRRLHPPLPHARRRHDPRAAAGAVGLRLQPAPTRSSKARWASTNYVATLKLTPVTDGSRTFAEWSAEFDCAEGRERELTELIGQRRVPGRLRCAEAALRGIAPLSGSDRAMLQKVVRSTVIDAPIERVWAVLRDFNSHDQWHDVVDTQPHRRRRAQRPGRLRAQLHAEGRQPHPRAAAGAVRHRAPLAPTASSRPPCRCSATWPPSR